MDYESDDDAPTLREMKKNMSRFHADAASLVTYALMSNVPRNRILVLSDEYLIIYDGINRKFKETFFADYESESNTDSIISTLLPALFLQYTKLTLITTSEKIFKALEERKYDEGNLEDFTCFIMMDKKEGWRELYARIAKPSIDYEPG